MKKQNGFSRGKQDSVMDELISVLSKKREYEFKPLFTLVHEKLRARNAASGGEEMMRLRCYEKLQSLVQKGVVTRTFSAGVKTYCAIPAALRTFKKEAEAMSLRIATIRAARR
jgi:hypothetical protein